MNDNLSAMERGFLRALEQRSEEEQRKAIRLLERLPELLTATHGFITRLPRLAAPWRDLLTTTSVATLIKATSNAVFIADLSCIKQQRDYDEISAVVTVTQAISADIDAGVAKAALKQKMTPLASKGGKAGAPKKKEDADSNWRNEATRRAKVAAAQFKPRTQAILVRDIMSNRWEKNWPVEPSEDSVRRHVGALIREGKILLLK